MTDRELDALHEATVRMLAEEDARDARLAVEYARTQLLATLEEASLRLAGALRAKIGRA